MALSRLLDPLATQGNVSVPLALLVAAIGVAGVAVLLLFAKDKI